MIYLYIILPLIFLWLLLLTLTLFRTIKHYRNLTAGVKGENLVNIWEKYLEKEKQNEEALKNLNSNINLLGERSKTHIQRVGVTRFNPFNNAGGNQSFAATLLDENGDGVLLSSLHGRDLTRVYAKPVKGYKPEGFDFSQEEQDAVYLAKDAKH